MKPVIAEIKPARINLSKGKEYYFCACGQSKKQPFCDGSHAGTDFKPIRFSAEQDGDAFLCQCKHSANLPYCDGTHKKFTSEQVGTAGPGREPT